MKCPDCKGCLTPKGMGIVVKKSRFFRFYCDFCKIMWIRPKYRKLIKEEEYIKGSKR